jgi:hypothetical protein
MIGAYKINHKLARQKAKAGQGAGFIDSQTMHTAGDARAAGPMFSPQEQ